MQREEVVERPAYLNKDNKRSKRLEWRKKKEKDRYSDNDNNYRE